MNNTEQKNTNPNDSQERRVVAYPPPLIHRYFKAYARYHDLGSESAALVDIMKKHFDSMPQDQKDRIINFSKNSY
jgi:hypothetical protein